ncbi:phosphatidylglycerophosphatase A [bacterium]|nr:phosphatidylglycerophosphatase A [bacterium]
MRDKFVTGIASGFGLGFSPMAPGTVGTVGGLLFWWAVLTLMGDSVAVRGVLLFGASVVGWWATTGYLTRFQGESHADPSEVVIDEWAGVFVALLAADLRDPVSLLSAFCLFRFFDIVKPWPVSAGERLPGATGVMLDDLIAGAIAGLLLCAAYLGAARFSL